jgi:hypothetical protein
MGVRTAEPGTVGHDAVPLLDMTATQPEPNPPEHTR